MPPADELTSLAREWLRAVARPEVSLAIESLYTFLSAEIEARTPSCWASGRCCNFAKTGHRLYVTGLEVAYAVQLLDSARALAASLGSPVPTLTHASLELALERGDCPFLHANLCSIHSIKPMGCRVYFCDRSAQAWQNELSERALLRLRTLHDAHEIPYRYAEWRAMLRLFVP